MSKFTGTIEINRMGYDENGSLLVLEEYVNGDYALLRQADRDEDVEEQYLTEETFLDLQKSLPKKEREDPVSIWEMVGDDDEIEMPDGEGGKYEFLGVGATGNDGQIILLSRLVFKDGTGTFYTFASYDDNRYSGDGGRLSVRPSLLPDSIDLKNVDLEDLLYEVIDKQEEHKSQYGEVFAGVVNNVNKL